MPRNNSFCILIACTLALVSSDASAIDTETSILISEKDQVIEITVPVAKLAIQLPKEGFKKVPPPIAVGSTANPRYFLFDDQTRGVRLSGWFESAKRFAGVKDHPPGTLNGKVMEHQNVLFKKVGAWEVVAYNISAETITIATADAHLVQAGSWVELHLSAYPNRPLTEQHALLAETIQSIKILEKQ